MPADPLQLLRLQFGLDPDPTPTEDASPTAPVTVGGLSPAPFGIDPAALARIQNGLPPAPAVPSETPPSQAPQGNTIQPAPASPRGPLGHVATVGPATGQPLPDGVQDSPTEGLVPAQSSTPANLPPPIDSELAGSPGYQAQVAAAGPAPSVPQQVPHQAPVGPPPTFEQTVDARADAAINEVMGGPKAGLAPTPEDVERLGLFRQDNALVGKVRSLELQAQLDTERARQSAPSLERYAEDANQIAAQRQAEIQRYLTDVRQGFDAAKRAAEEANANYPNPDDLLGGKGSWSRAIGLGLAAASAGLPGSTIASNVAQQMQLQMQGRQARFGRLKERTDSLAAIAEDQAKAIPGISAGYDGMLAAAQQRVAGQLQVIANRMAPGQAKVNLLGAASDIMAQSGKQMMTNGKDWAESQEKMAAAQKDLAQASKALRGGSGSAIDRTKVYDRAEINTIPEKDQPKVVWNDDRSKFVLAQSDDEGKQYRQAIDSTKALRQASTTVLSAINEGGTGSLVDKLKAKAGANSSQIAKVRASMHVLKGAYAKELGEKTNARTMAAFDHILDDPSKLTEQDLDEVRTITNAMLDDKAAVMPNGFINVDRFEAPAGPHVPTASEAPSGKGNIQTSAAKAGEQEAQRIREAKEAADRADPINVGAANAEAGVVLDDEKAAAKSGSNRTTGLQGAYDQYRLQHNALVPLLSQGSPSLSVKAYSKYQDLKDSRELLFKRTFEYFGRHDPAQLLNWNSMSLDKKFELARKAYEEGGE